MGGRYILVVGLLLGCAGRSAGPAPAAAPVVSAPPAAQSATVAAAAAAATAPAPRGPALSLGLSEMAERTGGEFGLDVPMLLVTVRNQGGGAIELPQLGVDLIVSLRLRLTHPGGRVELRRATLLRPWTVQLGQLAAGAQEVQGLSPLSVERRDVPLAPGRYRAQVCVPPSAEAPYPSRFTDQYGGLCSNEIEIEARKRRR